MKSFNGYKQCSKCRCIFPVMMFDRNKCQADNLNYWCKDCRREYTMDNREKVSIKKKEWYNNNRESVINRVTKYQKDNPEKSREYSKNWRLNNRELHNKRTRKWFKDNKHKRREYQSKRRRGLGYIELWGNPFPGDIEVDMHHINQLLVIPIPKQLHRNCLGVKHKTLCRDVIKEIYDFDIELILR